MRFTRLQYAALALSLLTITGLVANTTAPVAYAQSNISGDIVGTVTDSSGAVVTNATVTLKSQDTGASSVTVTSGTGSYRFPLLKPGTYKVTATEAGFQSSVLTVTVASGQISQGDIGLTIGKASQVIVVSETEPLLHTDSAQLSTSFEMEEVQSLPNPGNDLTFVAQTAPGAVMNTQSGYGNFSVFGLPGTSNTFTVNGGYENDPYLNVNNSGATNLLLGNNDISEVSVTTNAYDASFGGLGGAQVNEISRSGSQKYHGNATYWWNGSAMNANSWFNKNSDVPRNFDNVNQWAAAAGGPLYKQRTFFFYNYEGLRVVLPTGATVFAPSAQYEATAMANATALGEGAVYSKIFNVYNNAPGYKSATPYDDSALTANGLPSGNFVSFRGTAGNFTHEYMMSGRIDQILSSKDNLYGHFKLDKGLQATFTSLLDPNEDVDSAQPQYEGQLNETHVLNSSTTNQFLFAATYYRAIFSNANQAKDNAVYPASLVFLGGVLGNSSGASYAGWVGGENFDFPQGRNVTGYQFQDDFSWTRSRHSVKVGWTMRRDDVTDYSPSVRAITPEAYSTDAAFESGYLTRYRQSFPTRPNQPVALYTMGWYVQDQWKVLPQLTITAGLRFEHDSNPICVTDCFVDLSSDFFSLAASATAATPYNKQIVTGRHQAFDHLQMLAYEPRVGFAYQPSGAGSKTTIRGGFGLFADSFPAQIAGSLLNNAPNNVQFYLRGNYLVDTKLPGSGAAAVASSDAAFVAGFKSGANLTSLSASVPGFNPPAFTTAARNIKYPSYEEWSLAIERQIPYQVVVSASYVGNHGYQEAVVDGGANAYGFGSLPANAPTSNFGQVNHVYSGASSNYNGLIFSAARRSKVLSMQANYAYSHSLDEISNGGFDAFGLNPTNPFNPYALSQNYGNSDYDVRHYVSGSYVINVPHFGGPKVLTDGWLFAGTVFHSTGLPYSYIDSNGSPANYSGSVLAMQTQGGGFDTHCGGDQHAGVNAVPCDSSNFFAPTTGFGQQRRNQLSGPNYTDSDLDVAKAFQIPKWESANLKLGVQFFNVFNHPNFAQPGNDVEGGAGTINGSVNPPTSILGSFLGGDASPRLIQLKANFTF
ncbi:MAG: carboxypeptidase regulatory-like domain-containing protein [Terracidiphilus sp.]